MSPIGRAIVSADLADNYDLAPGDRFFLFGAPDAPPFELTPVLVGLSREIVDVGRDEMIRDDPA